MISMSYARTLADGDGLVWFRGAPRVEGFSNPLWTLMMAGLHRVLPASAVALAVMVIGCVLLAGSALVSAWIVAELRPVSRFASALAALLVGIAYPLVFWTLRGMEVGLLTFLGLLSCALALLLVRADQRSSDAAVLAGLCVCLGTGALTRTDFAVTAGAIVAWLAVVVPAARRRSVVVATAGTVFGLIAVMTTGRVLYYGDAVPNTYVLKLTGTSLPDRLLHGGLLSASRVAVIAALVLGAMFFLARKRVPCAWGGYALLALVAGGQIVYSLYVGGDAWEEFTNRYLVLALIVLLILAVSAGDRVVSVVTPETGSPKALLSILSVALVVAIAAGLFVRVSGRYGLHVAVWLFVLTLASIGAVLVSSAAAWPRSSTSASTVGLVVFGLGLLVVSSTFTNTDWLRNAGMHVRDDQRYTEYGEFLRRVTDPSADIAVVWAGASIYYSERRGVDLLGRSDRTIASSRPRILFHPGHDKWDYDYSIGERSPDVIANLWNARDDEIRNIQSLGFERICLDDDRLPAGALYVRRRSEHVRFDVLSAHRRPCNDSPSPSR